MNTAILVTKNNIEEVKKVASGLAERQQSPNLGKLLIIGGYYLDDDELTNLASILEGCYEVSEVSKAQVSEDLAEEKQLATMVATFLLQKYATVPGPWLLIDGEADVVMNNPLSVLEKAHNANGQDNTGRAKSGEQGARLPIGPVVLGAQFGQLRTITSVSGASWRERGKYNFGNICTWHQATSDEYPFRIPADAEANAESSVDPVIEAAHAREVEAAASKPSSFDLPVVPSAAKPSNNTDDPAGLKPVSEESASTHVEEVEEVKASIPVASPMFPSGNPAAKYLDLEKEELLAICKERADNIDGVAAPHHLTGARKLVAFLVDLDAKEAASTSE